MANTQYGIRHCNALVSDYDKIKNACPCMKCFGTGCDACKIWDEVIAQNVKRANFCMLCKFHNGR